jgi:DNA-binding NtrC family response regulator
MSLRILIVEDDALTAVAFAAALSDAGHQVVGIADNARAALAKVQRVEVDLALVDITLRDGRTGLAAARALHAEDIETVLVSGDADLRAKAEAVQAIGTIAKPADANAVARMVSNLDATTPGWRGKASRSKNANR